MNTSTLTTFQLFWDNLKLNFVAMTTIYDQVIVFIKVDHFKSISLIMLYLKSKVCLFEFVELQVDFRVLN